MALAQANWSLEDLDIAYQQATQAQALARQSELLWLEARSERILGGILVAQQQWSEAAKCFEQALKMFRKYGMRLEKARTRHLYGEMLVQGNKSIEKDYQRGVKYLQDARQVFIECKAEMDRKLVERTLERCGATVRM